MVSGTLDDTYFEWLYGLVGAVRNRNPSRSYWNLCKQLYTTEFVWLIANDDNRLEDGKELRDLYLSEYGTDEVDPEWIDLGCSMLEMLIALAQRAAFESEKSPAEWFGIFMDNLDLRQFTDAAYDEQAREEIAGIIDCVIYRSYSYNGKGGLFPLREPHRDQREVELWYQMAAYLLEHPEL